MRFYFLLALVNVGCFMPLYVLNVREQGNPFGFLALADKTSRWWPLRLMYVRPRSSDPFRIHFDFTFFVLVAAAIDANGPTVRLMAAILLALGFVEILYSTIMHSIFKRPPALASDLSLLASGLSLARGQLYWMAPLGLGALVLIWFVAVLATSALLEILPGSPWPSLAAAGLLIPPCLYHADRVYGEYLSRTVYSPTLHLVLSLRFGLLVERLHSRAPEHFERNNHYQRVSLEKAPAVVIVCVESYGSVVYRDPRFGAGVSKLLQAREPDLRRSGYRVASTFSEAPLFAGGSWLSYASFAYGARIDNVQLYDGLFSRAGNFGSYESLFHVLRRSGYVNVLLCPLGGTTAGAVDWATLDRCFQCQDRIPFEDLAWVGPRVNFFGAVRLHAPLDQYALNFGYERARGSGGPFSLFFCTLNSHYPWQSVPEATHDWRRLNEPTVSLPPVSRGASVDRYAAAIRYQLDYLLRFAVDRADDAPLIILFGDHQPPVITREDMGSQTPVHVLSQDQRVIDTFLEHGFVESMDLTDAEPRAIRHEGFLSLLMRSMQAAYGTEPGLEIPYLDRGSQVFDEEPSGR